MILLLLRNSLTKTILKGSDDLLELPILYLSSYIINHKKQYYEGLDKVRTKNDWESWIIYILDPSNKLLRVPFILSNQSRI